jgi:hypothetical protein
VVVISQDASRYDKGSTFVASMPEVLRWTDGAPVLRRIHDDYVEQLGERLGTAIRLLRDHDPARADLIAGDLREASDEAFLRVLTAPQTSFHLLRPRAASLAEIADHLHRSFLAEAARGGRPIPVEGEIWTALGDGRVLPSGSVSGIPPLGGRIALDLDSPEVVNVDSTSRRRRMLPLEVEDRVDTLARLEAALRGIAATSEHIADVVAGFIKVLVLQRDPEHLFGSASCQLYIGRTIITNGNLPMIDESRLAEAMVHEAVHSVLYMQVQSEPWGLVDFLEEREPVLVSPWTGRPLPLSTYLHACFVWYALVHFWGLALQTNTFPIDSIAPRLARAVVGFRGAPLLSRLDERHRRTVLPSVRDAIDVMQASVLEAMRETQLQGGQRP